MSPEVREQILDDEHLRLLSLGHYLTGGMHVAFASLFLFHFIFVMVGVLHPELFQPKDKSHPGPDDGMFVIFAWVLGFFILAGWSFGALTIFSGRSIKARKRRAFTFVMACLNTLLIPFGTVLGVFTLVVLSRPSVKRLYEL